MMNEHKDNVIEEVIAEHRYEHDRAFKRKVEYELEKIRDISYQIKQDQYSLAEHKTILRELEYKEFVVPDLD